MKELVCYYLYIETRSNHYWLNGRRRNDELPLKSKSKIKVIRLKADRYCTGVKSRLSFVSEFIWFDKNLLESRRRIRKSFNAVSGNDKHFVSMLRYSGISLGEGLLWGCLSISMKISLELVVVCVVKLINMMTALNYPCLGWLAWWGWKASLS